MIPKLFSILKHSDTELKNNQVAKDIMAGVIVAIIALPLSIALAIASGVSPEKGIITAIIAGFCVSLFGGSRVQIGGPTGAFVIIIYGIVEKFGIKGLTIATLMSGIILIIFGLIRFGNLIKYIPYPIVKGFTLGIAVVLFLTQMKDFFGLAGGAVPSEFFEKMSYYATHLPSLKLPTLCIGLLSVLILLLWPKISKRIPGSLVALLVSTGAVLLLHLPVDTIGSRFGELSSAFPLPSIPNIDFATIQALIQPAFTIALLAAIESLLSAVVADGMIGKKHNSNMELVGQGIANIASALFGGIPATGAIARTAANVKNGGRTPIAGIVHAIVLLLIMMIFMPYAKLIPMTTLAAILFVVAYNMSDWKACKSLLKSTKSDISILLITFTLTVVFDLVIAIEIGMVIAMFLFIKRISDATHIDNRTSFFNDQSEENDSESDAPELSEYHNANEQILVYDINGPLFFGAANTFMDIMNEINTSADILILRMKNAPVMDATAFNALKSIDKNCRQHHIMLLFSEIQEQPLSLMEKAGFIDKIGHDRFFDHIDKALKVANDIVELKKMANTRRAH